MSADKIDDVVVGITRSFCDSRWMPADQQRRHVMLEIKISESFFSAGNLFEIAFKIAAGMHVEAARARVNVNVNGSHLQHSVLCILKATDWVGRFCKRFALRLSSPRAAQAESKADPEVADSLLLTLRELRPARFYRFL